jgi:esterase/lipase superfamily enzyme
VSDDVLRGGWISDRLGIHVDVVRWGTFGQPVLLFPTAAGDAEEAERFLMMKVLAPLLEAGRIKVYGCDSVSGRFWTDGESSGAFRAKAQSLFDAFVRDELVPAIHADCGGQAQPIVVAGASIGAFNALSTICRNPALFSAAVCMSGTYDMSRWMNGEHTFDYHVSSPLHFVPGLPEDSEQLRLLRQRFVILATGEGRWEAPGESWAVARTLGARGIPNRVDPWGTEWDHDWITWRAMLPKYLDELTR